MSSSEVASTRISALRRETVRIDADEGNVPSDDVFIVSISDDDGLSWSLVEVVGPMGPETSGGWILHSFDAGALIDLTDQVRLRFVASDVGPLSIVEVGIDDLFVVSVSCGFPSFCDGSDGSLAACPCGNQGNPDTGCDIPQATGGVSKNYQLWFRSNPSTYCDAMAAFNLSNGRSLTW